MNCFYPMDAVKDFLSLSTMRQLESRRLPYFATATRLVSPMERMVRSARLSTQPSMEGFPEHWKVMVSVPSFEGVCRLSRRRTSIRFLAKNFASTESAADSTAGSVANGSATPL